MAKEKPRDLAPHRLSASSWRRCLRQWWVWGYLWRGVELCEGGAQRIEAWRVWEPVFVDEAPDCRCHGGELVVGEIDCRHGLTVAPRPVLFCA